MKVIARGRYWIIAMVLVAIAAPRASRAAPSARSRAIQRGVEFLRRIAATPANMDRYGADLLWCFYSISETSADGELRASTRGIAREIARTWLRKHGALPAHPDADDLVEFATAVYAAGRLGLPVAALRERIRRAAPGITVHDYLLFDPAKGPPPATRNRYDTWCDALITAHSGKLIGADFGAPYADVIRWLAKLRPYPEQSAADFYPAVYSVTHVVYTLNDYNLYAVNPACYRPEFEFLKKSLPRALEDRDAETVGEFLDSLRAFGMNETDPWIRKGTEFLLASQHADGSWGNAKDSDTYGRYHSTWTAVDGLREYRYKPARACYALQ